MTTTRTIDQCDELARQTASDNEEQMGAVEDCEVGQTAMRYFTEFGWMIEIPFNAADLVEVVSAAND